MEPIVNRVAESDIDVFDLSLLWDGAPVDELDLAPFLEEGLILREIPFRQAVKAHDWSAYAGRHVAVYCATDAIVPTWAFMLVAAHLEATARSVAFGRAADLVRDHFTRALAAFDWEAYRDRIVVVKGCGTKVVPVSAYVQAMKALQAVARKVMYGEPCSSVPLWRRPAEAAPPSTAARPAAKPARPPRPA